LHFHTVIAFQILAITAILAVHTSYEILNIFGPCPCWRDKFNSSYAAHLLKMVYSSGYQCAGCGEWNETSVDSSAGTKQSYIEDCQVCCKPNILHIAWNMSAGEYTIKADLE
jgi:hypothetical protein